jgi:hypothetical protein
MKISCSPIETTTPRMVDSAAAAAVRRSMTMRRTTAAGARCTRTTARASGTAPTMWMRKRTTLSQVQEFPRKKRKMKKTLSSGGVVAWAVVVQAPVRRARPVALRAAAVLQVARVAAARHEVLARHAPAAAAVAAGRAVARRGLVA